MRKFRIALIIVAVLLIISHLFEVDFHDLSWSNNSGHYLGIIGMLCLITAMLSSNYYAKKHGR
jgi:DMSO/TMAO reductase YedYZ heme-binding membrane subunit